MPKQKKGGGRGTVVKNLWDLSELQATLPSSHIRSANTAATYRHPRPVRNVNTAVLKRAFMLQNFQFILRGDLLTISSSQGLPQGQRKLMECIQSSDSIVPWETVHSVVMRTTPDEFQCPICMEMPVAPRITECGHVYCLPCILQYMSRQKAAGAPRTCPMCHDQLTLYTLRPCVLQPVLPLKAGMQARFDLFKRQRYSCVLRRYDDPFLSRPSPPPQVGGRPAIDLPPYMEPSSYQSRYVVATAAYEANQRCADATSISERMRELELEGAAQPLNESDAEVEKFLLDALNEVTKEPKALAQSMVRNSPPLAPRPASKAVGGEEDDYLELYAEGDGQPFYLHMLTVKMLKHDAKLRHTALPDTVTGTIEEIVTMEQNEETRHIYKVFSHVPLHGTIKLCVLNVDAMLLAETRTAFAATVRKMANERAQRRLRDDQVAREDTSWKQYLHKYSGQQRSGGGGAGTSSFSPDTAPSDFSIDTESLPYLQLPSSGSAGSDHGLPPSTLDTRQRATKRQELQPLLVDSVALRDDAGALASAAASTSLMTPTTNTSSNTGGGCWAQGSAAKLFAKHAKTEGPTATWGGHAFHAKP
ncbi:hypothetical protein ABB37_08974 [Leptomonas pyrrhocoris]|uniref:RING-type domain-containing protein n=1 Tax=Leptomonas pyrrhocoris TaxID=157538 RepID=A0A0N0VD43_LEPPY|nr:hypothetical protein ABB37_08974 [Leptomonas pyrrhocoris]XP_015653067.1 hypothetical protein ABB37_08974 [Leptomonas pyrrhocoris]KPA74627.1 hypothetical protein ABB37_08974 [Leptomonas pyrrhocoris]KPA74628.1 hypothetical protein ABB37_08974 [Leptomonas pyrrhocoris]|eukprot:XP_015653066.1 hypothetical protein ABB37_08974 [Leptomonas pyrrhocoris]